MTAEKLDPRECSKIVSMVLKDGCRGSREENILNPLLEYPYSTQLELSIQKLFYPTHNSHAVSFQRWQSLINKHFRIWKIGCFYKETREFICNAFDTNLEWWSAYSLPQAPYVGKALAIFAFTDGWHNWKLIESLQKAISYVALEIFYYYSRSSQLVLTSYCPETPQHRTQILWDCSKIHFVFPVTAGQNIAELEENGGPMFLPSVVCSMLAVMSKTGYTQEFEAYLAGQRWKKRSKWLTKMFSSLGCLIGLHNFIVIFSRIQFI